MANTADVKEALDKLSSGGKFKFPGKDTLKKEILKAKIKSGYGDSSDISDKEIDDIATDILENSRGELANKLDSDLAMIENSLSSVISQAPALLAQMATIPASMIQISPMGPTMPNPLDIKNALGQIKAQANSLSSLLSNALNKVVELNIPDLPIPGIGLLFDPVIIAVEVIAKIKNFGG